MMVETAGGLTVAEALHAFVVEEALPGTGIEPDAFFGALADVVETFGPRNRELLARRRELEERIDTWHRDRPGPVDPQAYAAFLRDIGYLVERPEPFSVDTRDVDPEIASVAGPQLVVPLDDARRVLEAANARWGSLYDALYETDAVPDAGGGERVEGYNPVRGGRVVARAMDLLDRIAPLAHGSHADATGYALVDGALRVSLDSGSEIGLADASRFVAYRGKPDAPSAILLQHHALHAEIVVDRSSEVGRASAAGVADVVLESAPSAILDGEDSIAAVDASEKVVVYRNWLGLMRGTLEERDEEGGRAIVGRLADDRVYTSAAGGTLTLPGRSLLLVRNVGAHVTIDAVTTADGEAIAETHLDAMVTALCALHDLARDVGEPRNSRTGRVYIVKPKMHGPDEVRHAVELFERVERALGMAHGTLGIGLMDEERRTSLNLASCIAAARARVFLVATGVPDRSGDEIRTSTLAGPMIPTGEMAGATWRRAYEDNDVDVALAAGFGGRGQIGKDLWRMPERMAAMLVAKVAHPEAGATAARVPSPRAATLHALHYHAIDVASRQRALAVRDPASLEEQLAIPLVAADRSFSADEIARELENEALGILGYVVRWVSRGVGRSTVPDIDDIGLVEDRATLRLSSQFLANWLHHGLLDEARLRDAMERMALVVDRRNADDPAYVPMAPDFDVSAAFRASLELVLEGSGRPNGYTEPVLIRYRRERKASV